MRNAHQGIGPPPSNIQSLLDKISSTQGTILYRGASSWAALAVGTALQKLITNGAAANPSWASDRELLTAARTYYVRTDGNDSNTGLVNSAGGAFLTVQQAINTASGLDNGGYDVTISIATGTYTGANTLKSFLGSGKIIIVGDETTPSNVVISTTSANCFTGSNVLGVYSLRGMRLKAATSGDGIHVDNCNVEFQNLDFNVFVAGVGIHIKASLGAFVLATGNYSITGGGYYHIFCYGGAIVDINSRTVTLTGTPAFTITAYVQEISYFSCWSTTFSGSATGQRYNVIGNGVIFTNGGGANFIPGNSAGATASGGQYL
jgi:hypothetical protein